MRKKTLLVMVVIAAILVPCIMVGAARTYDFTDEEVNIIMVPQKWGEPINVAGGRGKLIIMFEDGHIIVLARWLRAGEHVYLLERVR